MYTQFQLKNGITVGIYPMDGIRSVAMKAMLVAGPVTENQENSGISHFIEHCVLVGTRMYPTKLTFNTKLEELGVTSEGYTETSDMEFEFDIPYTNLFPTIDILNEVLFRPIFSDEAIEKERKVILEEMIDDDTPNDHQFFYTSAKVRYADPHHKLAMDAIGTNETLEHISKEMIIQHYHTIMVPNNIFLCLVGNIDVEKTKAYLEETLGNVPSWGVFTRPVFSPTDLSGYMTKGIYDSKFTNVHSSITFGAYPKDTPVKKQIVVQMLCEMLGNLRTSKLFQDVREREGLVYDITAEWDASFGLGTFNISFESEEENLERILTIVFEDLRAIKTRGFEEEEFELAKSYFKNRTLLSFSTPWNIVNWVLSDMFDFEQVLMPEEIISIVNTITLRDMEEVIKEIFVEDTMNICVMGKLDEQKVSELLTHYHL
jgi:predicted Zn-dependent peptidase